MATKEDIQTECIRIVEEEVTNWRDAHIHITPKVVFKTRKAIEVFRKNYYGVYDKPIDPTTGRPKIWVPLSESMVEAIVAKTDLDQKDINMRSKVKEGRPYTELGRALIKNYLDSIFFGEHLDESERELAIDGTIVWKTQEKDGRPDKQKVDLLNVFIDPTEHSIQKALRFTERSLMTPQELRSMDWENTNVEGSTDVHKTHPDQLSSGRTTKTAKLVDVYELWGRIPKWLVTGSDEDRDSGDEIEGRIVVSGLDTDDKTFHFVDENKTKDPQTGEIIKPYEEARYQKVPGRWYGRGVAEKLLMLQLWINIIVNIRINRSYVQQLGLFKIRKGAGITPQKFKNLPANGAIVVNSMDDIQEFVMSEASQASYNDEQGIIDWAERVTSAFSVVTGEELPSSTPATNAIIQDRNARSQFTMVKNQIGTFLQRWIDRHVMPILAKNLSPKDVVRLTSDDMKLRRLIERVVAQRAQAEIERFETVLSSVALTSLQDIEEAKSRALEILDKVRRAENKLLEEPELFVEEIKKGFESHLYTKVYVTNEELDVGVTIQNALALTNIMPEYRQQLGREIADMMGIELYEPEQQIQEPQGASPEIPQNPEEPGGTPTEQKVTSRANLPELTT